MEILTSGNAGMIEEPLVVMTYLIKYTCLDQLIQLKLPSKKKLLELISFPIFLIDSAERLYMSD